MKLLFINAHPDDVEFTCASTCQQAVQLGWEVHEILMTSDEYGTKELEYKGKRIRHIRKHEMVEAAKVYGVNAEGEPLINLIWFNKIDANLPFNLQTFKRLRSMVEEINPDVIIGPDGFFTLDEHPDHMRTGWLVYLIVKAMNPPKQPILLLYHSTNTNFYIPIKKISIQVDAWAKHRSQTTPLFNKLLRTLRKLFYCIRKIKTGPLKAEGFRRVKFNQNENKIIKLRHRIIHYIIANEFSEFSQNLCHPTPKELGLIE